MTSQQLDEERIFHIARQLNDESSRSDYLDQICAGDQALRERVEGLLQIHEREQSFLKSAEPGLTETVEKASFLEKPGTTIGRYKLMEQVGEGGMGTVFVAQQDRPIRRKVALKVVKPGMDSNVVIARFEAERQALAVMDHPNIAKVLDAGATERGRPYFVMELVRGIPITHYCDEHRLSIEQRLELFNSVCQAIQHAHQKGIIHRDIKPSNVLVTELDGKPVPKVIDFGVAKALNQSLTDRTIYTSHQSVIGTPLYMSPEQASLSAVDVDTRSDIYSLGVLLYELLTGTTPFEHSNLDKAAQHEVLRIIREVEPPRPSNRISTLGETASQISQLRRTQVNQLGRTVKGDLDWIVMKSLSKERSRRYKSADEFADDIIRHINGRPIHARAPTFTYLASRFIRRNTAVVLFAVIVMFLGAALVGLTVNNYLTETALADQYRQQRFKIAVMKIMSGKSANELIKEAEEIKLPEYQIRLLRGMEHLYSGESSEAIKELKVAVELEQDSVAANAMLSWALYQGGRLIEGVVQREKAINLRSESMEPYEQLLLAHASFIESEEALRGIDQYLEAEPSPIGLLIRAEILAWHVNYFSDKADARDAMRRALLDVESANRLLNTTAYSLGVELWVCTQAMRFGEEFNEDLVENLNRASELESALSEQYPNYIWGNFLRAAYWDYQGNVPESLNAWTSSNDWRQIPWCQVSVGLQHYRLGNTEKAAEFVRNVEPLAYRLLGAPMLLDSPNGTEQAIDIYETAKGKALTADGSQFRFHYLFDVPLLLGKATEAKNLAEELLDKVPHVENGSDWEELNFAIMKLIAGRTTPEHLLDRANSASWVSFSNYYIGLMKLTDPDSSSAKRFLHKSAHEHYFSSQLAGGYLKRMEEVPSWPKSEAEPNAAPSRQ